MRLRFAAALLGLFGVLFCRQNASAIRAEEKRLSISGTARIEQRPDVMDVAVNVSAGGHMTADALKKFRSNRRRGVEAINKLKIKGLEVKGSGISVVSSALVQQFRQRFGNMQQASDGDTTFSETLTFVIPGIDHLTDDQVQDLVAKILDAAKDAGLTLGFPNDQNPYVYNYNSFRPQVVFFRVADAEAVRQKALDLAAKDARSKAEQMAKRLNLTIGNAVTVRDSSSRQFNVNRQVVVAGNSDSASVDSSPALHNMTIEAVINVEYEIVK